MDQDLEQQIAKRMQELPADVQAAIRSADIDSTIRSIGSAHQLHVDQIGTLEDEIVLVMLGFTDPSDFASNIEANVRTPKDTAEAIAQEVSEKLFVPIRESMQHFAEAQAATGGGEPALATPEPVPAPAAPAPSSVSPADVTLSAKTVTTVSSAPAPQTPPPATPIQKVDPYREPIE